MIDIDDTLLAGWPLPQPDPAGDKEERGRLVVVGGSAQLPGAVILAAIAALRAGAGKVQIVTPASIALPVGAAVLEGRVFAVPETAGGIAPEAADAVVERARQADALLLGPGIVDERAAAELLGQVLPHLNRQPTILDAGALTALAHMDRPAWLGPHIVITPHAGEMATLIGQSKEEVLADPPKALDRATEALGVTVVLKGAETLIRQPGGKAYHHRGGTVGLATGGSGDILAGIIGGLLARGASPDQAAAWAVAVHARAGGQLSERVGPLGFLARELLPEIPALVANTPHG
jgi:ADP-dependent NAD(P)H-hydrate dehydratase